MATQKIEDLVAALVAEIETYADQEQVVILNMVRRRLHEVSPFKNEPVDLVEWVPSESVHANSYNPNSVAPPEMRLLEHSILSDGYTQPIVTHDDGVKRETVDGFHRGRVGKESSAVRERVRGYLPVVSIRAARTNTEDRMASTVRHNRARGVHGVAPMTDLVAYLAKKGWDDGKIGKELGMDADEVADAALVEGHVTPS